MEGDKKMAESNPMSVGTNAGYNNCFTLGGKRKQDNGYLLKVPMYIEKLWYSFFVYVHRNFE